MTSATIVFSFFILLAFLSVVKASIAGTHATCVYHHFFSGSNLEFMASLSTRCIYLGTLAPKMSLSSCYWEISHPQFYGLAAWDIYYVPDLFGVCQLF